jgi:hypothetical protein
MLEEKKLALLVVLFITFSTLLYYIVDKGDETKKANFGNQGMAHSI